MSSVVSLFVCDLILYFVIMRNFECNVVDPQIITNLKNLRYSIFIKLYKYNINDNNFTFINLYLFNLC